MSNLLGSTLFATHPTWLSSWAHLGHEKQNILAILNLYVAQMPPIKFELNPTYSFAEDVV